MNYKLKFLSNIVKVQRAFGISFSHESSVANDTFAMYGRSNLYMSITVPVNQYLYRRIFNIQKAMNDPLVGGGEIILKNAVKSLCMNDESAAPESFVSSIHITEDSILLSNESDHSKPIPLSMFNPSSLCLNAGPLSNVDFTSNNISMSL